jgi:carboxyl-terminal processing protease
MGVRRIMEICRGVLAVRAVKLIALLCISLMAACVSGERNEPSSTTFGPGTTSSAIASTSTSVNVTSTLASLTPEAEAYLDEALDLVQQYSINSRRIDWNMVRDFAFKAAGAAQTPAQTHGAIIAVLPLLEDDHSIFLSPAEADDFSAGDALYIEPEVKLLDGRVGYVSIGRYYGDIGAEADAYAADLSGAIGQLNSTACGWVVDLRSNTGGNMWPMIAGLSPVLGPGTVGYFTYPDGRIEAWEVGGDVVYWNGNPMVRTAEAPDPAVLDQSVAVLIGASTGSSGEAAATAFHGRPNTRFFGQQTAGLTTANEPVVLSDGAMIALTMSVFTDRNGHAFGQGVSITPDEFIEPQVDALTEALSWLRAEGTC